MKADSGNITGYSILSIPRFLVTLTNKSLQFVRVTIERLPNAGHYFLARIRGAKDLSFPLYFLRLHSYREIGVSHAS